MIHLYAEHLLNINTLSIQASLDTASDSGTSAALSNDGKSLVVSHERERTSTELPTYISPGQADSIKFPILSGQSTELSFRIPLDAKAQNGTGTLRKEDSDHGNLVPLSAAALTSRTEIYCSQCSSVVVERGRIQIWKDMPSQGWAEMMEFWHCHKPHEPHRHEEGEMQKGYAAGSKLAVEPGIGLVDTGDFIFAPEDCINLEKHSSGPNAQITSLHCIQCSARLGKVEESTQGYQLHKPGLSITNSPDQMPISFSAKKWLSCQILAAVESQGVRKFIIQPRDSASIKPFKIWVLTPDLVISSSASPFPRPLRVMKILWDTTVEEVNGDGDMRTLLTESELRLDTSEIESLLETLHESTLWLPKNARRLQTWNVGLLERFNDKDMAACRAEISNR